MRVKQWYDHRVAQPKVPGQVKDVFVIIRLTDILEKVKAYHPNADTDLINRAYVYSAQKHA